MANKKIIKSQYIYTLIYTDGNGLGFVDFKRRYKKDVLNTKITNVNSHPS